MLLVHQTSIYAPFIDINFSELMAAYCKSLLSADLMMRNSSSIPPSCTKADEVSLSIIRAS